MKEKDSSIELLISGGFIGSIFGAWLSKDQEEGALIGAILGAAFSATTKANEEAKKTNKPLLIAEQGKLYRVMPNGDRQFIKDLPQSNIVLENHFKLK